MRGAARSEEDTSRPINVLNFCERKSERTIARNLGRYLVYRPRSLREVFGPSATSGILGCPFGDLLDPGNVGASILDCEYGL